MDGSLTPEQEALAYLGVTRLQSAYADAVTRRAWDDVAELFAPEAPVRIDTVTAPAVDLAGGSAVASFISAAVERFEFFSFVILNTVIDVCAPDEARARMWMVELRQDAGNGLWSNAYGLYRDDYRRSDGRWRFAARDYRSLARTGRGQVLPFPDGLGPRP